MESIRITQMTAADVPQVHALEALCFTAPWDIASYYQEVANPSACYLVARDDEQVTGFGGMWIVADEAHIATLAVHPDYRRRGLGRRLMHVMLQVARYRGATTVTLEVRAGNIAAQHLYTSLGFLPIGRRRHYYPDNNEDAIVMRLDMPAEVAST